MQGIFEAKEGKTFEEVREEERALLSFCQKHAFIPEYFGSFGFSKRFTAKDLKEIQSRLSELLKKIERKIGRPMIEEKIHKELEEMGFGDKALLKARESEVGLLPKEDYKLINEKLKKVSPAIFSNICQGTESQLFDSIGRGHYEWHFEERDEQGRYEKKYLGNEQYLVRRKGRLGREKVKTVKLGLMEGITYERKNSKFFKHIKAVPTPPDWRIQQAEISLDKEGHIFEISQVLKKDARGTGIIRPVEYYSVDDIEGLLYLHLARTLKLIEGTKGSKICDMCGVFHNRRGKYCSDSCAEEANRQKTRERMRSLREKQKGGETKQAGL